MLWKARAFSVRLVVIVVAHRHMHSETHSRVCVCHTCIHTYMRTHTHAYTHTCIPTYMHTHIHAHTHTCIRTYMHTHIHAYTHTCMHTYVHPHIRASTHTCKDLRERRARKAVKTIDAKSREITYATPCFRSTLLRAHGKRVRAAHRQRERGTKAQETSHHVNTTWRGDVGDLVC